MQPFVLPAFLCVLFFTVLNCIIVSTCFAGNKGDPLGGRSAAISHASVTLTDGWSCYNNQAGLGYLKKPTAGVYFENKYNVKEFSTKAVYVAYPFKPGTMAVNFSHFGFSKYGEMRVGLAYGTKLTKRLAVGVQANFMQTHFTAEYGNFQSIIAEVGLLYEPLDNLYIGFHLFKPSASAEKLLLNEQKIRFGASYLFENKALVAIETDKGMNTNMQVKIGLEITLLNNFYARAGIASETYNYSFGLGYVFKGWVADISFTDNRILGFTPQASLGINL